MKAEYKHKDPTQGKIARHSNEKERQKQRE